jgi:hypothetical protein
MDSGGACLRLGRPGRGIGGVCLVLVLPGLRVGFRISWVAVVVEGEAEVGMRWLVRRPSMRRLRIGGMRMRRRGWRIGRCWLGFASWRRC